MADAQRLFAQVWNLLTADWGRLTTFRQMGVLGEDAARQAMHRNNTYLVQQQLVNGPLQHLLTDRESFVREGMDETMPQAMTEAAVLTYRSTLHAATLVFGHAILDAAVFDCLKIAASADPSAWAQQLAARKVSFSEVGSRPYEQLLRDTIDAELERLERESLITKSDRLFQLCRPAKQAFLTNGFRFDRDRLSAIDTMRHSLVHKPSMPAPLDSAYEDMQFMQSSGLHLPGVNYPELSATTIVSGAVGR